MAGAGGLFVGDPLASFGVTSEVFLCPRCWRAICKRPVHVSSRSWRVPAQIEGTQEVVRIAKYLWIRRQRFARSVFDHTHHEWFLKGIESSRTISDSRWPNLGAQHWFAGLRIDSVAHGFLFSGTLRKRNGDRRNHGKPTGARRSAKSETETPLPEKTKEDYGPRAQRVKIDKGVIQLEEGDGAVPEFPQTTSEGVLVDPDRGQA